MKHNKETQTVIKCTMTFPSLSPSDPLSLSPSGPLSLSPSGLTGGSTIAQSGRSMVEMLGTLAIIGILSVGGIAGYSYGMDKWRANATINDINLRAVDLITQLSRGGEPKLSDTWKTEGTAGYPITLNTDYAPSQYFIKVEKIPLQVCKMIVDTFPDNEVEIWIDNEDKECKDLNTMDFGYTGFVKQGCSTSTECRGDTPVCNPDTGICEPYPDTTPCGGECPADKPYCDKLSGQCGTCKYDSDCPNNTLCLHKNGTENACLNYGFVPILSATDSPDGREWIGLQIQSRYVQFDDAIKLCKKYGKTLAYPDELVDATGKKTEQYFAIQDVDEWHHTWSNQENPDDPTQAFLMNLTASETAAHCYYYAKTALFYAYCR